MLIFAGFAIRPLVQTVAGETDPTSIAYVAELQKLAGLAVNGRRQYYEDSLYWVIWYLGVPAVLLGAFGLAMLTRRCAQALVTWKDPSAAARVWALPLMIALWVIVTVLWRPAVSPDQPWASRRLVPFVLPGLILGAIWAATWLKDQAATLGRTRMTSAAVASCCVASLLIPTALTTLDLGVTKGKGLTAHGMAFRAIGPGELAAVNGLCRAIGPDASVVILDSLTADRFAQVIRGMCGTPAAVLTNPSRTTINTVVSGIESVGRRPVLLAQQASELPGSPREVVNLLTTQEAHNLTAPPTRPWLIHYTVWMSVPASRRGLVSSPVVSTFTGEEIPHASIVLPCFNEEEHVLLEVERICAAMDKSGIGYELLAVDDGSTDQTLARLRRAEPDFPNLRVIHFPRNGGAGTVRRIGTQQARGEIVVWTDADLTYPNERIPEFVAMLDADPAVDQVVGARTSEEGTLKIARVPAKWFVRKLAERLTNADIPDLNSGLRAFRRAVALPYLKLLPPGFSCVTTITLAFLSNGHEVRYVPIDYAKRAGRSKFHFFSDAYRYVLQVLRMVMYFNPLKVLMPPALFLLGLGAAKGVYDLVVHPLHVANDTLLIFVTGMILASLALLADLIVRSRA